MGDGLADRSHFVNGDDLVVADLPAPALSAAAPLFPFAASHGLSGNDSLVPDFGFVLGHRRQDSGVQPPGRRLQAEAVFQADEIDVPLSKFVEELAEATSRSAQ